MNCLYEPLTIESWTARAEMHAAQISPMTDPFIERRGLGIPHAVYDFLFTYYTCSPQKLKQWIPAIDQEILVDDQTLEEFPWLKEQWFCVNDNILTSNKKLLHQGTLKLATFIYELCGNILERPPRFGCFGLHEWAMVYKLTPDAIRHKGYRLRLSPEELARFVESQTICCSHYDAYRFFTKEALPLNVLNPVLETRLEMEQAGCLHANMDIYKWAAKLWPWIGSDFLAQTFFLAKEGRELDMRASPYDLLDLGFEPICIETEEGRKQYQIEQQRLTERSTPLRKELRTFCERLILSA